MNPRGCVLSTPTPQIFVCTNARALFLFHTHQQNDEITAVAEVARSRRRRRTLWVRATTTTIKFIQRSCGRARRTVIMSGCRARGRRMKKKTPRRFHFSALDYFCVRCVLFWPCRVRV
jgi:hypothetical protein